LKSTEYKKDFENCGKNVRNEAAILDEKTHCRKTPTQEGGCEKPAKTYK
jgi:hypothetical protein